MSKFLSIIFICSLICGQVHAVSMDDPGIKRGMEIVPISRDDLSINRGVEIVPISLDDPAIKRGIELISISRDDPSINRGVEVVPISLDDPNINPGIELVPISLGDPNINLGIAIVPISLNGPDIRRGIEIISMGASDRTDGDNDEDNEAGEQLTAEEILKLVDKAKNWDRIKKAAREEMYGRDNKILEFLKRFTNIRPIDIFKLRYEHNRTLFHLAAQKKSVKGIEAAKAIINYSSYKLSEEEMKAFLNARDDQGMTAFHHAVRRGDGEMVSWAFIHGNVADRIDLVDLNAVDNYGRNAAHHAISLDKTLRSGFRSAIEDMLFRLSIEERVDMTAQDNDGRNILHYAVERGDFNVMRVAASYCRDIKATDNRDRNPFHDVAEIAGEPGIKVLKGILSELRFPEQDIEDALGMFDKQGNTPQDIAENFSQSLKLDIP